MSEMKAFELKAGKNLETDSPIVVGVDNKWNSRIMSGEEVYLKFEVDKVIAEKDKEIAEQDKEIAELKSDIADLRDDKKSTDAILDERNAEIAELERRIADGDKDFEMAAHQNERLLKSVRHHKYKRCLAMADYSMYHHFRMLEIYGRRLDNDRAVFKINFGLKWLYRWLELAEKFKEAK